MNDLETSVLTRRLRELADELTPDVDVTTQVRAARSRHRRQRRGRLAVLATVAATVAVVGVPTAIGVLSSQAPHGQTAGPGVSTPTTSSVPSPSSADQSTAEDRLKAARTAAASPRTGG